MKLTSVSPHFSLEEFVPEYLSDRYGPTALAFVSKWQIDVAEGVRQYFGDRSMTINNWCFGGKLQNRGTRLPNTTVGAYLSQHKFKSAIDFTIEGVSPDEVYKAIVSNQPVFLAMGITTIEDTSYTPTWTHIDCRQTLLTSELKIVSP